MESVKQLLKTVAAVGCGAAMLGMFGGATAHAQVATANLNVSATVSNNCTISTAALAFGAYDPVVANAASNLDGTGTVTIACTRGALATIGFGVGSNASGATRRMTDGATNYLSYELYQDATRTTVWTDSGGGLFSPIAAPSRAPRDFPVYGRVAGNQDVPAGGYNDVVVATVNF